MNKNPCKYNPGVDCEGGKCWLCGWNPSVSAKRAKEADKKIKLKKEYEKIKAGRSWVWRYREVETVED